jgi:hypothetical protein
MNREVCLSMNNQLNREHLRRKCSSSSTSLLVQYWQSWSPLWRQVSTLRIRLCDSFLSLVMYCNVRPMSYTMNFIQVFFAFDRLLVEL